MQTEPPKTDLPKRKRRWFQFGLRSLLVFVTLLAIPCGYAGWQAKIVRERKSMREWIRERRGICMDADLPVGDVPVWSDRETQRISSIRNWLGDRAVTLIEIDAKPEEIDRIKVIFPEALVDPAGSSQITPPRRSRVGTARGPATRNATT
jgi:hypothetical protein